MSSWGEGCSNNVTRKLLWGILIMGPDGAAAIHIEAGIMPGQDIFDYGIKNLVQTYLEMGISGLIPLGTTKETPCISDKEAEILISATVEIVRNRISVYVGYSGNNTLHIIRGGKIWKNSVLTAYCQFAPITTDHPRINYTNISLESRKTQALIS